MAKIKTPSVQMKHCTPPCGASKQPTPLVTPSCFKCK